MKKMLAFLLALTLLCGLGVPAVAATEDNADAHLAAVTLKVKNTLQLDTEAYTEFYGDYYEEIVTIWSLTWSNDKGQRIHVEAEEDGTIRSYDYYDDAAADTSYSGKYAPKFPEGTEPTARKAAETFLRQVLDGKTETVQLEEAANSKNLRATNYRYTGVIRLNGVPSPLAYSISVRMADNRVTSFYRDTQGNYLGAVTAQTLNDGSAPNSSRSEFVKAGALLEGTLAMRLEYVRSDEGDRAVLRYLPEYGDEFYVDAATGNLVNLTELRAQLYEAGEASGFAGGASASDNAAVAEDEKSEATLTETELAGAEKLKGVLAKDVLDGRARAISALGLGSYTLGNVNYSLNNETEQVFCRLQYTKKNDMGVWRRYVTLDARTGALDRVSSSIPWSEEMSKPVAFAAAQTRAETFLQAYFAAPFAKTGLKDSSDAGESSWQSTHAFTYTRMENGYYFSDNALAVSIDATDGSVASFYKEWDDELVFDSASGIVGMNAALDAWYSTYAVQLGYTAVPERLDLNAPEMIPYINSGYRFYYRLKLGYTLTRQTDYVGVDAKTGKPVERTAWAEAGEITYSDIANHWVRAKAERLAGYQVGWLGGKLEPAKQLTQLDLLALLVSANGSLYDLTEEGAADQVYQRAYNMGLLTRGERQDKAAVTRGEMVKLVISAGGFREAAELKGVFRTAFSDDGKIPAAYYGYAALAQGLGIISGGTDGAFAAGRAATRAEALAMLCNLMER